MINRPQPDEYSAFAARYVNLVDNGPIIETLELLEELLSHYQGTLLLVSHDRKFLDNVVTSTLVFEGNGKIEEFTGGYQDWLRQTKANKPTSATIQKPITAKPNKTKSE